MNRSDSTSITYDGIELAGNPDRHAFAGELVDHVEHKVFTPVVGVILDEVVEPTVFGMLRPQAAAAFMLKICLNDCRIKRKHLPVVVPIVAGWRTVPARIMPPAPPIRPAPAVTPPPIITTPIPAWPIPAVAIPAVASATPYVLRFFDQINIGNRAANATVRSKRYRQ